MSSIHEKFPWIKELGEKLKQERMDSLTPKELTATAIGQRKPLPEYEHKILTDPDAAFSYAVYVLGGQWPAAETMFMHNARFAFYYALHVIKAPWPAGEDAINSDSYYRRKYEEWKKTNAI